MRSYYTPRAWQSQCHIGLKGKKNGLWICSRQIGKTVAAIAELIDRTLKGPPDTANAYLCPQQSQARRIAWPELKRQVADGLAYCTVSETQLMITLPGNRVIYCLGTEQGDSLRGLSLRVIVADEMDSINDQVWREVVLPTVNEYQDDAFFLYIGTLSGGDSTLWRLLQQYKDDPEWFCRVTTAVDSGVFPHEWIEKQRKRLGESAFLREMMCDPRAPVENAVLGEEVSEAEKEGRVCAVPYRPGVEVITAYDLGIRDATSVWGYMLHGRAIEVLFYREYTDLSTVDVIGKLLKEFPRYRWGEAVLPHDARGREKSTGFTVMDAFYERWPGYVHAFKTAPSPMATLQAARINLPRCYFDASNCELGILRLKSASYVIDTKSGIRTDRIKHDENSHCIDAFRYGAWRVETMYSSMSGRQMGKPARKPNVHRSLA